MLDFFAIGFQIVLPLATIAWLGLAPLRSRFGLILQVLATGAVLLAVMLVAFWSIPPWWAPYLYFAIWGLVVICRLRRAFRGEHWLPRHWAGKLGLVFCATLGGLAAVPSIEAIRGRSPLATVEAVDLAFPMREGTYLVANGGASEVVNAHFLTLHPETARQRAYRGQSFAVDLVKINDLGLRTSGWRPHSPEAYEIFGESIQAPCDGTVLRARDGMPDMPVPRTDMSRLEGNHVLLRCGDYAVLLAHLRQGSVRVSSGDRIHSGAPVAEAGNSGQSTEPHLHVHVQRLPETKPLLSGEPLQLTFDGVFPARNDRLEIEAHRRAVNEVIAR